MPGKRRVFLFITLWLIVTYNSQWTNTSMPIVGFGYNLVLEGILLVLTLPSLLNKMNEYKIWVVLIVIYWGFSTIWSVNHEAFDSYWKYSLPYIIAFAISSMIQTKKDVESLLKINVIAASICAVYVLLFVNTGDLSESRLGQVGGVESVWNANDIGIKMTIGYAFSIYFLLKEKSNRLIWLGLICLFIVVSLMSGSRSVIVLIVGFTAYYMIERSKKGNRGQYFIIAFFFVIGAYWAIMNIPILYDILGRRIDLMITGLTGGEGGHSMDTRSLMIASGFEWFFEKPWLGYGFNGYCKLFGDLTGIEVYSHSNIVELLVNSGIMGFVLYYSLTIWILVKLWKPATHEKDPIALVLFSYTLISTVMDYVVISYVNVPYIARLMYTAMYCRIVSKNTIVYVEKKNEHEIVICNK